MPKQLIVKGHTLPHEGRTYSAYGHGDRNGLGVSRCSCGAESPVLPSTGARQRWHREHKLGILAVWGIANIGAEYLIDSAAQADAAEAEGER